jgi:hypothetical protein
MSATFIDEFRRYESIIGEMLRGAGDFTADGESAAAVRVERGLILVEVLKGPEGADLDCAERLIELARIGSLSHLGFVDRAGHQRPVYRALAIYAWLSAFSAVYEWLSPAQFGRWEEGLRVWCDFFEGELGDLGWSPEMATAGHGAAAVEACWTALALQVAGKVFVRDAWTDLASDLFGKITRGQLESGAFLLAGAEDNPESHWYDELVILHAAAAYAAMAEDRVVARAVARNTEFHLRETQPDHATSQPFGLFAFIWNESTRGMADQQLHAIRVSGMDGVSAILLADVIRSLRLFTA